MSSPVSSNSAVSSPSASQAQAQPAKQPSSSPQDSVHLSPQALAAAGGDADHDGDSH